MRGRVRLRALRRGLLGWGRGVYVIGMHRSGTSAVTRVVDLLGVPLGDAADLIGGLPQSNPAGHWESTRLTVSRSTTTSRAIWRWLFPASEAAMMRACFAFGV